MATCRLPFSFTTFYILSPYMIMDSVTEGYENVSSRDWSFTHCISIQSDFLGAPHDLFSLSLGILLSLVAELQRRCPHYAELLKVMSLFHIFKVTNIGKYTGWGFHYLHYRLTKNAKNFYPCWSASG